MEIAFIFVASLLLYSVQCYNSASFEYNGIEVSPFYETIIYSDIADIINEFENNNVPFDKANNESESDEEVEGLLSEYHHYLEKAHKQRLNYMEKNKLKNKVPVLRHEKFTKMKSATASKQKGLYQNSFYNSEHRFPQSLNPFNMFIPFNSDKYLATSEQPANNNDLSAFKNIILNDEGPSSNSNDPVKLSCYCKDGRASCKQCFMQQRTNPNIMLPSEEEINNPLFPEQSDDTINVRIKVDVQMPKLQQYRVPFHNLQSQDKMSKYDVGVPKEYFSAIKLPSPYLNLPIPISLMGYEKLTKNNKYELPSMHKLIHKKKKSKVSNINKKHRKKVITFHNIIEPKTFQNPFQLFNMSVNTTNDSDRNNTVILSLHTNKTYTKDANVPTSNPFDHSNVRESQTEENILLWANNPNNIENGTNEKHKTENSIETEYTNVILNATTDKPLHLLEKREVTSYNGSIISKDKSLQKNSTISQNKSTTPKTKTLKQSITARTVPINKTFQLKRSKKKYAVIKLEKEKNYGTKLEKNVLTETELLYWPVANVNKSKEASKNITTIILENENKKAKLNMSIETLRRNHTRALEQAIFGNVNWNDVDAVAPAFISFVGKYIEGIFTFCNERICHSMKCSKKNCLHRVCAPKDRFNNKGHCTGSNYTDSIASMESIMDLPSKIAFEIVDILQDRMIGKLFGKITLCITSKCITLAASKKVFYKNKCTIEKLNPKGHCIN